MTNRALAIVTGLKKFHKEVGSYAPITTKMYHQIRKSDGSINTVEMEFTAEGHRFGIKVNGRVMSYKNFELLINKT